MSEIIFEIPLKILKKLLINENESISCFNGKDTIVKIRFDSLSDKYRKDFHSYLVEKEDDSMLIPLVANEVGLIQHIDDLANWLSKEIEYYPLSMENIQGILIVKIPISIIFEAFLDKNGLNLKYIDKYLDNSLVGRLIALKEEDKQDKENVTLVYCKSDKGLSKLIGISKLIGLLKLTSFLKLTDLLKLTDSLELFGLLYGPYIKEEEEIKVIKL
jgi:hypothetical protein